MKMRFVGGGSADKDFTKGKIYKVTLNGRFVEVYDDDRDLRHRPVGEFGKVEGAKMKKEFKKEDRVKQIHNVRDCESPEATVINIIGDQLLHQHDKGGEGQDLAENFILLKEAKYDPDTVRAIKESIEHHEDNLDKLKNARGAFLTNDWGGHSFHIGGVEISFSGGECALCAKFSAGGCKDCPLSLEGYGCGNTGEDTPWQKIKESKTQEQAITAEENMVKVLKSLLEKEDTMGLKERIEELTGWDCGADNLLQEIIKELHCSANHFPYLRIVIPARTNDPVTAIEIWEDAFTPRKLARFDYTTQDEKLQAFKDALLWLAEKAGVLKKYTCEDCGREIKHRGRCLNCNSKRKKIRQIDDEIESLREKKKRLEVEDE